MKLLFIFLTSFFCSSLWAAASCESQKIAVAAIYQDTKEVPLLEDWSEASGAWHSILVSDKKINRAQFRFVEAKTKNITRWTATLKDGKIEKLPLIKILGDDKKREGVLTIKFFKDTKAVCESLVNIHYADQLDFKPYDQPASSKKSQE